ncbi:MAG: phosphoribosyltransferase, partial [Actinomycetota bacterium]|nr:phosphoribosyltransferase [Actinomycetota bacterium]
PHRRPMEGEGARAALASHGLLAERRAPVLEWKDQVTWTKGRRVPGRLERLLLSLVMEAKWVPTLGFFVPLELLREVVSTKKRGAITTATLLPYITGLRNELRGPLSSEADNPILRASVDGEDGLALNTRVVRCDWFEVRGAELTATTKRDPSYERAYALSMAERAYVESMRDTDPKIVEAAKQEPPPHLDEVVRKRWELRKTYLETLVGIGHVHSAVGELMMWEELMGRRADAAFDRAGCRDEFFGLGGMLGDANGRAVPPIEAMGTIPTEDKTLAEKAEERREAALLRSSDGQPPNVDDLEERFEKARLEAREKGPNPKTKRSTPLHWSEVTALLHRVHHRLTDLAPAGFNPQVIVGLGRGGNVVAAALSEVLHCHSVGTISVDRHNDQRPSDRRPIVRGADLPDKRGCTVLVCDDIVTSGRTVKLAIDEVIRPHYPDAAIVVATLILNIRGQDITEKSGREITWAAGLEVDVIKKEEFWVDFCWRTLDGEDGQ